MTPSPTPVLLQPFRSAGLVDVEDLQIADRLGRLGSETDPRVLLAVGLAVRALRQGSVALDLATVRTDAAAGDDDAAVPLPWPPPREWLAAVAGSPMVGPARDPSPALGTGRPLVLDEGLLYLEKYWLLERAVADRLTQRRSGPPPPVSGRLEDDLAAAFDTESTAAVDAAAVDADQLLAVRQAVTGWTTVLTGGPGTGKTTTVARILAAVRAGSDAPLRLALAAPTGKAAHRLTAAVHAALARTPGGSTESVPAAVTVHRLLGATPGRPNQFRHHPDNRLPHDLIVVDEVSMLSLDLMAALLGAVRPDARLVLVGDAHQLASVQAGAVLADLTAGLTGTDVLATLRTNHRTRPGSAVLTELSSAVVAGDADAAVGVLTRQGSGLEFIDRALGEYTTASPELAQVRQETLDRFRPVRQAAEAGDAGTALALLGQHQILCAHRTGPFGVVGWNSLVQRWLGRDPLVDPWYPGLPLVLTGNDRALGLVNGDTGVVVRSEDGELQAVFPRPEGPVTVSPWRLTSASAAYALTIHRSQGSEYPSVTVVLPPADSPLLTRETLYTAITRCSGSLRLIGPQESVRAAVTRRAVRASGLAARLRRLEDGPP